ncbi:hypothetical protein, partial [Salmonella sp. s51884]|uniref:hypothetical protein n=1 Tax=Salmonella sp. s51884 TaxID=3159654 RepID=UPI003980F201
MRDRPGRGGGFKSFDRDPMGGGEDNDGEPEKMVLEDTIFVSGLPKSAGEEQLVEFFGAIGIIKIDKRRNAPKVWIYKQPNGDSKGEATITYDDTQAAKSAIDWFNGKDFQKNIIKVQLATRTIPI